ncbi:phosphonatase-like hydrolase [Actinomadura parmotrematis]|uniref:Phosphonatase-like hydrolase n=1 Tax=Actinomadura parmotrematis TaxID=2864039 RepID=A0ABS7FQQ8_9ACTN|nr:phosphonatase-like hydrolase [Actinomadura parmotrematis]MBW8482734.1 phosphonatase-like hydrolase [Actinomadura parmotrematis]
MSAHPPFALAALDMAGTTVQEGGAVYAALDEAVAARIGRAVPAETLHRWTGTSKREAAAGLLTELTGAAAEADVDAVYADFTVRLAEAYAASPPVALPGVTEAVGELRAAGVKVVLQTGYSREVATSILKAMGWTVADGAGGTVDGLVASDEVAASRPAPYLVFRAMELAGVTDVARVLVAGDTPNDLRAGVNAGAGFVVGVLSGAGTAPELGACRHTHLLESAALLPGLL